jgi:hypothetical protein
MDQWPAEVLDVYKEYAKFTPIDLHSNFAMPLANLSALIYNANRGQNLPGKNYKDFLMFNPPEADVHIDELLLAGGW